MNALVCHSCLARSKGLTSNVPWKRSADTDTDIWLFELTRKTCKNDGLKSRYHARKRVRHNVLAAVVDIAVTYVEKYTCRLCLET